MMYYRGKQFDAFENAIHQLTEYHNCEPIAHLNCMSRRNFGYVIKGQIGEWFRSYLQVQQAIANLRLDYEIPLYCKSFENIEQIGIEGVVLGPVSKGTAVPELRSHYYQGAEKYLFVTRKRCDAYNVSDPAGMPGLLLTGDELLSLLGSTDICMICLLDNRGTGKQQDLVRIYRKGLSFHRNVEQQEYEGLRQSCGQFSEGIASRIALQCGVMNGLMKLDQIVLLADESKLWSKFMHQKYILYKNQLLRTAQNGDVGKIPGIWIKIWELLEHAE